jgi:GNAT superfamily N-acetyltransferase
MRELRPHLTDVEAFVQQLKRQAAMGYRLQAAWVSNEIAAVVGYRPSENLMYGRFVYVDDLVVRADRRRTGLGEKLIDWVRNEARNAGYQYLILDTGLGMALAQRFYFRQGLLSRAMGFYEALKPAEYAP